MKTPVLFTMPGSVYYTLPNCDCYDKQRDARTVPRNGPVIAHPPCPQWSRLRAFATPDPDEKALAPWAIDLVRQVGGVLEHPAHTTLWAHCGIDPMGKPDLFGGWSLPISQRWFGHRAEKPTWLYVVGIGKQEMPAINLTLGMASHAVETTNRRTRAITKAERNRTPLPLAQWLIETVSRIRERTAQEQAK